MKNVPNTPTPTSIMLGPTERAVLAIPVATSFNPVTIDSSRVNPAEVIFVFVVFVFKSSCKRYKKRGKFSFPPMFLLIQISYFSILCEVFFLNPYLLHQKGFVQFFYSQLLVVVAHHPQYSEF